MRFFTALSTIALIIPAFAAPTKLSVKKLNGPVVADSYIITLKKGSDKSAHVTSLNSFASVATGDSFHKITHEYDSDILHGYTATLRGAALDHILSSKDVDFVEQNGIVTVNWEQGIDLEGRTADSIITKRASGGAGVTVYGIDTGIYTAHSCFGGRASWGATFGGYANQDGNGHGTHTAGTAVGSGFGVATSANIVAIKVLSDSGSGTNADVISGINWASSASKSKGGLAVATMSLGGAASSSVDSAVSSAISGGLHFSIAAGNSNVDASTTSPARVAAANTVGAVDSSNRKASFSNYGSILDIWALGVNVKSAWIGSTGATNTISGTSMATPFVAGVLAVALGEYGAVTPASLSSSLKSHARALVTGQPSGTTNLLATVW